MLLFYGINPKVKIGYRSMVLPWMPVAKYSIGVMHMAVSQLQDYRAMKCMGPTVFPYTSDLVKRFLLLHSYRSILVEYISVICCHWEANIATDSLLQTCHWYDCM